MSWKSLLINDENEDENGQPKEKQVVPPKNTPRPQFPETPSQNGGDSFNTPQFNSPQFNSPQSFTTTGPSGSVPQTFIDNAMAVYKNGFDSLNQAGYDFYELYQMVSEGGDVSNPQVYQMAFRMATTMDKTLTKDKLLLSAEYYLSEINKQYNNFVAQGNTKKDNLITQKNNENHTLTTDLESLNQQLEALKIQINDRQNKLNAIDSKYAPLIGDVENKLEANSIAKNQLVQSIEQIKSGISNNIK